MSDKSKDLNGRPYAKLSETKLGDVLIADSGFTCILNGAECQVMQDDDGLYVPCQEGRHYLDGQTDDGEILVGLYRK